MKPQRILLQKRQKPFLRMKNKNYLKNGLNMEGGADWPRFAINLPSKFDAKKISIRQKI